MPLQDPPDFELLFRSAPSLLLVIDAAPGFRILEASDAYLRARRTTRAAIVGRLLFEVFPEPAESASGARPGSLRASLERVLATGKPDSLNTPVVAGGRIRYVIHRIEAIELELLKSAHDRDEAIRKLRAANEGLEAFAFSASHDLQAPLRAVDGLCRLLREAHGDAMPADARELVARIDGSVARMSAIIEALLGLSRIGRAPLLRKRVDMTAVAHEVIGELRARDPQRVVAVDVVEGLEDWADERLVGIALRNVIGNAWKYTARRDEARIEIGQRMVASQKVFYVRDNGAGFDMAAAGKLFTPFVRLHAAGEYEGHGIGLATVKRIVERHGGEIWADARPDRGATINFTLNAAASVPITNPLMGRPRLLPR